MYTIGEVAQEVGLSAKTIRFYEKAGVINAASRAENGYRQYPAAVIEELRLLKYVRDLGLPLGEIKKLLQGCENNDCEHSKEYIQSSIASYLGLLNEKIAQLQTLKHRLLALQTALETTDGECARDIYCCNILHQLIERR